MALHTQVRPPDPVWSLQVLEQEYTVITQQLARGAAPSAELLQLRRRRSELPRLIAAARLAAVRAYQLQLTSQRTKTAQSRETAAAAFDIARQQQAQAERAYRRARARRQRLAARAAETDGVG